MNSSKHADFCRRAIFATKVRTSYKPIYAGVRHGTPLVGRRRRRRRRRRHSKICTGGNVLLLLQPANAFA